MLKLPGEALISLTDVWDIVSKRDTRDPDEGPLRPAFQVLPLFLQVKDAAIQMECMQAYQFHEWILLHV